MFIGILLLLLTGFIPICRVKSFKTDGDNAAEAPADYAAVDQKIVFEENKNSIPVNIVIVDDAKQESTENFGLMLTCEKPDCVKVNKANVEITDDDSKDLLVALKTYFFYRYNTNVFANTQI